MAVKDLDGDALADLIVSPGAGYTGRVAVYFGRTVRAAGTPPEADGFAALADLADLADLAGGGFVG